MELRPCTDFLNLILVYWANSSSDSCYRANLSPWWCKSQPGSLAWKQFWTSLTGSRWVCFAAVTTYIDLRIRLGHISPCHKVWSLKAVELTQIHSPHVDSLSNGIHSRFQAWSLYESSPTADVLGSGSSNQNHIFEHILPLYQCRSSPPSSLVQHSWAFKPGRSYVSSTCTF